MPPPWAERPATSSVDVEAVQYLDALHAAALRLTRDAHAAQDLVQDTFVKVLRFGHRFEPGTNLRGWLFTILHNTFRNGRRGAGRSPVDIDSEIVDQAPAAASAPTPEGELIRAATAAELRNALDALPEAYRQAVWLRDVEEFSYAEIAGILEVPIGTVMSRIARGRRLLQKALATSRLATRPGGATQAEE
jgi:RNA polymerase sigma-70 factor (ECF subfamily)